MIRHHRVVLASGSPRRYELLAQLGLEIEVLAPEIDETPIPDEAPRTYVERLAVEKARVAVDSDDPAPVVAADTAVVIDDEILGKPHEPELAARMLRRLSGRSHVVVSGIAVASGERVLTDVVETTVRFADVDEVAIEWYVATGDPLDKAGAYGIQGRGGVFVAAIDGSYSNVVGLPLVETMALLRQVM